jgi:hypothetical protein
MLEIAIEDVLGADAKSKSAWDYPGKSDPRFRDGLIFPAVFPRFRIPRGAQIFTIGSCFARNVEEKLEGFRLPTMQFSVPKSEWKARPNGLLNEYTPGAMLQRIGHAVGGKTFAERAIVKAGDGFADLLLPGGAPVSIERVLERRQDIDRTYGYLKSSEVVIITLGLVQSWFDSHDQLYLNRMPTPWAMKTHPGRYSVRILDVDMSYAMLRSAVEGLIAVGIAKILITVSPVPMQKSFSGVDAAVANSYSKSVLRTCADRLYAEFKQVDYFPSYEIVLSAGVDAFKDDNVHVRDDIVGRVIEYLTESYVS